MYNMEHCQLFKITDSTPILILKKGKKTNWKCIVLSDEIVLYFKR